MWETNLAAFEEAVVAFGVRVASEVDCLLVVFAPEEGVVAQWVRWYERHADAQEVELLVVASVGKDDP